MNVHITLPGVLAVIGLVVVIVFLVRVAYLIWLIIRWGK